MTVWVGNTRACAGCCRPLIWPARSLRSFERSHHSSSVANAMQRADANGTAAV